MLWQTTDLIIALLTLYCGAIQREEWRYSEGSGDIQRGVEIFRGEWRYSERGVEIFSEGSGDIQRGGSGDIQREEW